MNYKKITSLVPEGEFFDETAIGEGVYLTVNHLNAIESELGQPNTADAAIVSQLDSANLSVQQLTEQMATMHTAETVNTLNARIATLETENKELGKKSSGNGTALEVVVEEVETGAEKKKLTMNDAEHPVNVAASHFLAAKANAKKVKTGV